MSKEENRVVPVEPTDEMLLAAHEATAVGCCLLHSRETKDIWSAMLAAAPAAPQAAGVGEAINHLTKRLSKPGAFRLDDEPHLQTVLSALRAQPQAREDAQPVISSGRVLADALRQYGFPVSGGAKAALSDHGSAEALALNEACVAFLDALQAEQGGEVMGGDDPWYGDRDPHEVDQAYGEYDGTCCVQCGRERVMTGGATGRRICEKCGIYQDEAEDAAFIAAANPAAAALALLAENAALRDREKAALKECSEWARQAGEAIGKLETSQAAGIVEGWRDRATEAERKLAEAEQVIRDIAETPYSGADWPRSRAAAHLASKEADSDKP